MTGLPSATDGALDVVKLTTGIFATAASIWFPPAAFAGPVLNYAVEKFVDRPKRLLLEQLRQGNIGMLSKEDAAEFIPMGYRFLEAAKEGDHERNLKILAAYIAGELREGSPKAMNVKRVASRIEGLEEIDLQVIALIKQVSIDENKSVFDSDSSTNFVAAALLEGHRSHFHNLNNRDIKASLANLSTRGPLLADGASRLDKKEEYYDLQPSLLDVIKKASSALEPSKS